MLSPVAGAAWGPGIALGDGAPSPLAEGRPGGGLRIEERRSPNCGPRRDGAQPDMVVLHYTAMGGSEVAADRLCDPGAEVSAHYLVGADGAVLALVPEALRAWHAGASAWGGVRDVNSRSIGIELDNPGHNLGYPPFAEPQMAALEVLLAGIQGRWAIPPERVVGHACIAPGRKIDPGEKLDWRRLARRGFGVWLDAPPADGREAGEPADPARFRAAAQAFGYPVDESIDGPAGGPAIGSADDPRGGPAGGGDCSTEGWTEALRAVWLSFAMRFRPADARSGPHAAGVRHLEALAARWPVASASGLGGADPCRRT